MTNHPLLDAADALSNLLILENAALSAMNIPGANALLEAKRAATDTLVQVQRRGPVPPSPQARAITQRLHGLARENKLLLERAMVAQNRVMACIARAVPKAIGRGNFYGANGAHASSRLMPPVALSSRA